MRKSILLFPLFLFFYITMLADSFAATTATITVTATVLAGQSSISVDTSLVNFGAVTGSSSKHRFTAGPVKVSYFAGSSAWTVRVYTANPDHIAGLEGLTYPAEVIPLRAWCGNYGPKVQQVGHPPDVDNIYFWNGYDFNGSGHIDSDAITSGPAISEAALKFDINGNGNATDLITPSPTKDSDIKYPVSEEPVWLNVPDVAEVNPGNWRRLAWANAELDPNGFPVYFGIEVQGVVPQDYRTTTLTFQIISE